MPKSNCSKKSGQGRPNSGVREQPKCFFDHLLKVVDTHSDQRQVAQLIALFSSDQRKLYDFKTFPAPAPVPSEGRCWPNTASKKKRIQLEKQGQYEALKKQFTGDAYLVDMGRPMSTATAEKRMQNFVDSKRTLQQLYEDQEPGFRRYLLEDDVIPDLIQAYDRRILEMSWRIAGPAGREAVLEDHLDPDRLEEEAPESEYSMLDTKMPDLDPHYKFLLIEYRRELEGIVEDSLKNTSPADECRRTRQLKALLAKVKSLQASLDPVANETLAVPIVRHIDTMVKNSKREDDLTKQRTVRRLSTGERAAAAGPSTPGASWDTPGASWDTPGVSGANDLAKQWTVRRLSTGERAAAAGPSTPGASWNTPGVSGANDLAKQWTVRRLSTGERAAEAGRSPSPGASWDTPGVSGANERTKSCATKRSSTKARRKLY